MGNGDCNVISAQREQSYLSLLCSPHISYIYVKSNGDQKALPDILEKNPKKPTKPKPKGMSTVNTVQHSQLYHQNQVI